MKYLLTTTLLITLFYSIKPPYAQGEEGSCNPYLQKAINRLEKDNLVISNGKANISSMANGKTYVVVDHGIGFESEDTPTGRVKYIGFYFFGSRARNFLSSPSIQDEIAATVLQKCNEYATVVFGLYATSVSTTMGLEANGKIETWKCYEDLFGASGRALLRIPRKEFPKWGYEYCSL